MKPTLKQVPRLFGTSAMVMVAIPLLAGVAAATYAALTSNYIPVLIALGASAVELIVLPFAARSWFKAGRPRSTLGVAVSAAGLIAALPAAYFGLIILNPILPLMPWERSAIAKAENYVQRHGFTTSGHPADQPVLTTDIMDHLFTQEQLLEHRRGSLNRHASGIATLGFGRRVVLFSPGSGDVAGRHGYRQVEVRLGDTTHMPHQEYGFPEWMIKHVTR